MTEQTNGAAVPVGMVAWTGGDSAPADWDGGPVYRRALGVVDFQEPADDWFEWQHHPHGRLHDLDIIAYTPLPATQLGDGEVTQGDAWARWSRGQTFASADERGRIRNAFEAGQEARADAQTAALRAENERLRFALAGVERVMRTGIHENDGPDRVWLDGVAHEGPLAAFTIRCFRKVGEIARAALTGEREA